MKFTPTRRRGNPFTGARRFVGFALSGLDISRDLSQGVALGYHRAPLWGF